MHFTEIRVASYFIDAVLRDPDKSISVHGDGEYADVEKSREYFTIRDHMGECAFDDVGVWSDQRESYIAWFQFVYGNVSSTSEPMEVISDYTANEYGDNIIKRVEWCTE